MRSVNVGVIGLGLMGGLHSRIYAESPLANLVAVADSDEARLSQAARDLRVKGYEDFSELLSREDIEAVSICTPDQLHLGPTVAAARAGKHILLEKPLATTVEDARKIVEVCRENGVKLMIGYVLRFDPRFTQAFEAISRGEIGRPVHICAKRINPVRSAERLGGRTSVLFYLGPHDINYMRWFVGSPVERVYAEESRIALTHLGVADTILGTLKFANGAVGSLETSWALPNSLGVGVEARVEIAGTKGAIFIDVYDQGLRLYTREVLYPDTMHWPIVSGRVDGDLRRELEYFLECVVSDKPPLLSGEDGLEDVYVIAAMERSIKEGRPIKVSEMK
ncbi:MAG: Gfo/Idh/MocA family protein [bacterium]